jgi:hypothetical protein
MVRIQARVAALATVMVATQLAIACVPATSAADGFEGGVGCEYEAPGAIVPPPVHPEMVPGTPYTSQPGVFRDSEKEPASDFSATVNWGDGTTSPATVQEDERCSAQYEIFTPSHTYLAPGTYSVFYTVHDAHTGLEHTIDAEPYYVLSTLPAPISGASPLVIHAAAGVTWGGVVGEFERSSSYLLVPVSVSTWSIEWGDGRVSPGTVSEPTIGRLAISGSHTYARPLSGAVKVRVSAGIETGTWTTANVLVPERPFKLVGRPILAVIPSINGGTGYEIIFRLNRPLPQTKFGHIRASLSSHGIASSIAAFGPRKTPVCYAARSDALATRSSQAGRRYPFALTIRGLAGNTKTDGQAIVRTYTDLGSMRSAASEQLGC